MPKMKTKSAAKKRFKITATGKVLSAAALTYVAALAMAVAQLLRLLLLRGRN